MAEVIDFFQKKDEQANESFTKGFKVWLPLPIRIPDNFKTGHVLLRMALPSSKYEYEYLIPDEYMIQGINKNHSKGLYKEEIIEWCLMKNIESLIADFENSKSIS